ncbi:MAG: M23 family metallopeptidase [Verrucomicrobia bacterium]|nr:M23 family metallopeptidase [Verrucomicrobiota bacterium]
MIARLVLFTVVLASTVAASGERVEIVFPTANPAWAAGKPFSEFIQHAGSGDPASGLFGGVRNGGRQFHEGIDIRATARDKRGEALDSAMAAMDGVVRYICAAAGGSSYGRYIVLEHPGQVPAVYTLYAHLAQIAPGLRVGNPVPRGQVIGTMGHSSGGYMIPKDRAHVHFEIGVAVTKDFGLWYDRRRFGSRNEHGMWNGMNLLGIDPLDFLNQWRLRRVDNFQEYFSRLPTVVRLRIATKRVPDFTARYPGLLTKPVPLGGVAGWEIRFNWTGVPFSWTPLTALEVMALTPDVPVIVEVNAEIEQRERSKSLAVARRGGVWGVGKDLEMVLQQLGLAR